MTDVTKSPTPVVSQPVRTALELPNGARFYRCALQVNPFAYLRRHNKRTPYQSESDYNKAIVDKCLELGIEVIGVTDHYRVRDSGSLVRVAREAGIHAFTGFEAVTKDGVHFLCLFDPDKDKNLDRFIGDCGIHDDSELSPIGRVDSIELLDAAKGWGAVCIAAHVASKGGLLRKLSGRSRVSVWTSPNLLACALAGPIKDAPDEIRPILENKDAQHKRARPVAIINASDVSDPEDLENDSATCFVKMSSVSVEAFRQAFLDPASRIRLHSDADPEPHAEFVALSWESGGFLSDTAVHFNENLNVMVGGRGTGKSTVIESIRYVLGLDPLGDEARNAHEGIVRQVLRSGTKISLLIRSHKPSPRWYTIERSVPNPPVVKDEDGAVLELSPDDVLPGVEVFGQHEISELANDREKRTFLLERFMNRDPSVQNRKKKLRFKLEQSRRRIIEIQQELDSLDERLATLPGLEETHERFKEAGLEDKLKEKSLLVREERLFATLDERLEPIRTLHRELIDSLPIDSAFVSTKAVEGLPNADLLAEIERTLATLSDRLRAVAREFGAALKEADNGNDGTRARWDERRKSIEATYEKLLRELQKSNVDGEEFIRLRQRIEELRPQKDRMKNLERELDTQQSNRRTMLSEWEDIKASEFREIERAAKRVSNKLTDRVKVSVTMAGNRGPLEELLREVGGNLSAALERLRILDQLSLPAFANACREGKDSLMNDYRLPAGAAERIASADPELIMRIEELELPPITEIELNVAPRDESPDWHSLETLSTGQKATAVLLLLLLESEAPLVIDQPEDDLDNRFITEGVVPMMRREKRRRQFVFSTHNANIPVLGDAELILGLAASGEAKEGHARIAPEHMGSIDNRPVQKLIEEVLEGGREAFETRRSKYGF